MRQQVLDEAMALFGEVGYRSASLREIATRCGISHAGVAHHFPSKAALLMAVLAHREEIDFERYVGGRDSGAEELLALVEVVEHNATVPGIVELFAALSAEAASPGHPAHEYFVRRYVSTRASITASLERARDEGSLRDGVEPHDAAVVIVALMDGLQVQWLLDRRSVDMAARLRSHIEGLLTSPVGRVR